MSKEPLPYEPAGLSQEDHDRLDREIRIRWTERVIVIALIIGVIGLFSG